MKTTAWVCLVVGLGAAVACSSSDSDSPAGTGGTAGTAGQAGAAATAGTAGTAGSAAGAAGASGADSGIEDAPAETTSDGGLACNVAAQDCPGTDKCVLVNDPLIDGGVLRTNACVASGEKALGDTCTRIEYGHDDCAKGLFCTFLPDLVADPMHCRKMCVLDTDCTVAGEACYNMANGPTGVGGVCLKTCTPFGTDCLDGQDCRLYWNPLGTQRHPFCFETTGTKKLGESCGLPENCKDPDTQCDDQPVPAVFNGGANGTCRPMCDTAHPCEADGGLTCTPLPGFPAGLGVCR